MDQHTYDACGGVLHLRVADAGEPAPDGRDADVSRPGLRRAGRAHRVELLGDVADRSDHVLVTRNGKPAAALISIDEYEALEETAEILSDVDLVHAIDEGLGELDRGETVSLDELRRELAGHQTWTPRVLASLRVSEGLETPVAWTTTITGRVVERRGVRQTLLDA